MNNIGIGETVPSQQSADQSAASDVIIVGAGISGLAAALDLGRSGARVTVVDMASVFGGHAVMSSGLVCFVDTPEQRRAGIVDTPELAVRDFTAHGDDSNQDWAKRYSQASRREIYDWLRDLGVGGWELFPPFPGNTVQRQHWIKKERGLGLVSPIYQACLQMPNLSFKWNTKATKLLLEAGRINGVYTIHERTGQTSELRAAHVILATGGFESNLALVREHWPTYLPPTGAARVLLGSGMNSQGSGLPLAKDAGAAMDRLDHQLFYATGLVDPRDPSGQRGLNSFNPDAIWVNQQGRRFVRDGTPDPKIQVRAVLQQDPPAHWQIFDVATRPKFFVSGSGFKGPEVLERENYPTLAPWIKQSDSIVGLARAAGLPEDSLRKTVDHWNEMVDRGEDRDFHRFEASSPRLSKILSPPFFAVQLFPLARKSLGGVATDLSCRVLDGHNQPIPGLYAVGEVAGAGGINGKAALEGTMLGPGMLMGRTVAREILTTLGPALKPAPPQRLAKTEPPPESKPTDSETLVAWQEALRLLVEKPRPGFWHFEKAHARVLSKRYDCAKCHREPSPLAVTEDRLDRQALLSACPVCHGAVKE